MRRSLLASRALPASGRVRGRSTSTSPPAEPAQKSKGYPVILRLISAGVSVGGVRLWCSPRLAPEATSGRHRPAGESQPLAKRSRSSRLSTFWWAPAAASTNRTWRGYLCLPSCSRDQSISSSLGRLGAGPQDHDRADLLAVHLVGHADDRDLGDRRVAGQRPPRPRAGRR